MDLTRLERKLIEAARANTPSERVPYAFEQRVLARLKERPLADVWALWARALWRAAVPCVAITLVLGAWALFAPVTRPPVTDFSQQFESTLLAAADQEQNADSTW